MEARFSSGGLTVQQKKAASPRGVNQATIERNAQRSPSRRPRHRPPRRARRAHGAGRAGNQAADPGQLAGRAGNAVPRRLRARHRHAPTDRLPEAGFHRGPARTRHHRQPGRSAAPARPVPDRIRVQLVDCRRADRSPGHRRGHPTFDPPVRQARRSAARRRPEHARGGAALHLDRRRARPRADVAGRAHHHFRDRAAPAAAGRPRRLLQPARDRGGARPGADRQGRRRGDPDPAAPRRGVSATTTATSCCSTRRSCIR